MREKCKWLGNSFHDVNVKPQKWSLCDIVCGYSFLQETYYDEINEKFI